MSHLTSVRLRKALTNQDLIILALQEMGATNIQRLEGNSLRALLGRVWLKFDSSDDGYIVSGDFYYYKCPERGMVRNNDLGERLFSGRLQAGYASAYVRERTAAMTGIHLQPTLATGANGEPVIRYELDHQQLMALSQSRQQMEQSFDAAVRDKAYSVLGGGR